MPKAKAKSTGRRRVSDEADSSSEDENAAVPATQMPPASQNVSRAFSQLSVQDREQAVNNIVRYLLIADQRKMPIKRADVVKHALKDNGRALTSLVPHVAEKLRNVFGVELVEIEMGKQKAYILANVMDNSYNDPHQIWSDVDNQHIGLVMVILSVIFMRGNVLPEDELFDMLKRLGVSVDRPDETFGDVRRLITQEFVRMGYLDIEREQGDPPTHSFRWGARARVETNKRNALDFMGQVFEGEESQHRWIVQMREADSDERAESTANGVTDENRPGPSQPQQSRMNGH